MKILVVHRQKEVVNQIKLVLQNSAPIIRYSDSGLDGLLAARIESFDLVICGTDLPVVTGFELVRTIRTSSVNKSVPVIFLSDLIDKKTEQLGQSLAVAGMLGLKEIDNQLAGIVSDHVKPEPDKIWNDLLLSSKIVLN